MMSSMVTLSSPVKSARAISLSFGRLPVFFRARILQAAMTSSMDTRPSPVTSPFMRMTGITKSTSTVWLSPLRVSVRLPVMLPFWVASAGARVKGSSQRIMINAGRYAAMKDNIIRTAVCPLCGRTYHGAPALSREDNKTLICPDCGTRQALRSIGVDTAEQEQIIETIHRHMESRER